MYAELGWIWLALGSVGADLVAFGAHAFAPP